MRRWLTSRSTGWAARERLNASHAATSVADRAKRMRAGWRWLMSASPDGARTELDHQGAEFHGETEPPEGDG